MKREIFRRGVRMQHPFGELESRSDPLGSQSFDPRFPKSVQNLSRRGASPPLSVQTHGQHDYRPDSSPVCKPGRGVASANGPSPDVAMDVAMPVPIGTTRRKFPK